MPRSGDIYSPPAGTKGTPGTTIQSSKYNALVDDLTADANLARPLTAGGTGATNATTARANLGLPTGTSGHVLGFLDAANTWSAAQTFTAANGLNLSSVAPTLLLTDTDTGATGSVSANSTNGSVTIAADTGNAVAGSTIRFTIDGQLAAILDLTGFSLSGTSSVPISSGGTGAITADAARANLGLGALATMSSVNNINWSGADLAVENGGTGASSAAAARTNLGLGTAATANTGTSGATIPFLDGANLWSGANTWSAVQTFTAANGVVLSSPSPTILMTDTDTGATGSISANSANGSVTIAADTGNASSGSTIRFTIDGALVATLDAIGNFTLSAAGTIPVSSGGTGSTTASGARSNLGLGTLATLNSVNNGDWLGTDLSVANGGTGASDAAGARSNLNAVGQDLTITAGNGLRGGGSLAANRTIDVNLSGLSAVSTLTAPRVVVTDGATTGSEARMTAPDFRTAFGFGSLSTLNSVNDSNWSGTDLAVANGGTGASTASAARTNLELGPLATLDRSDLVYTGNNAANLDYPIGSVLWVFSPVVSPNRNASAAIYLRSGDSAKYSTEVSGTALTGTWRSRGAADGNSFILFERTA